MNPKSGSHGSSRKIRRESGKDGSLVSMRLANLSPNGSEFGTLFLIMSLVNVDYSLSKVILGVLSSIKIFDSKNSLVWLLILSVSFEAEELGLDPKSDWGRVELGGVFGSLSFDHWFIIFLIFRHF